MRGFFSLLYFELKWLFADFRWTTCFSSCLWLFCIFSFSFIFRSFHVPFGGGGGNEKKIKFYPHFPTFTLSLSFTLCFSRFDCVNKTKWKQYRTNRWIFLHLYEEEKNLQFFKYSNQFVNWTEIKLFYSCYFFVNFQIFTI